MVTTNVGSIDFSSLEACKSMGAINAPVMIDQEIRAYVELPSVKMDFPEQSHALSEFVRRVYETAVACRNNVCGGRGDCKPNKQAWTAFEDLPTDYAHFFIQSKSECLL